MQRTAREKCQVVVVVVVAAVIAVVTVTAVVAVVSRFPLFCGKWPLPKQSKSSWPLLQQQQLLFDCLNSCKK